MNGGLDVDRDLPVYLWILFQYRFYCDLFTIETTVNEQAVAVERARRGRKVDLFGGQRQPASIGKLAIHVDIIVRAFLKAIGIQVEIDTINLLGFDLVQGD